MTGVLITGYLAVQMLWWYPGEKGGTFNDIIPFLRQVFQNDLTVAINPGFNHSYLKSLLLIFTTLCHLFEAISLVESRVLEGRCPAEFSSNPNQTHLNKLINVFKITRKLQTGVFVGGWRTVALQDRSCPALV